jgi:hypothetical protein
MSANWFEMHPDGTALFLDTKTSEKPRIRIASKYFNHEFWDLEQASIVHEWVSMLTPSNLEEFKSSLGKMVEALEELEQGEAKML